MMFTTSLLMSLALKSVALAAVSLLLLRLAQGRSPAERSLIAHLGLLAILLLPAATLVLPAWAPLPPAPSAIAAVAERAMPYDLALATELAIPAPSGSPVAPVEAERPSMMAIVVWLYALPLAGMLAMTVLAVLRLFAMRRRAEVLVDSAWLTALAGAQRRMGYKHGTALLVSNELSAPISWGVLRPTILLDARAVAAADNAEAIIAHELAHVARLDWAKLLLARLACVLFWFNPLVWLLSRESHQLREETADDTVLLTDIPRSDYAALLVNAARHDNNGVLIAAHGVAPIRGSLRRRVVRALDASAQRRQVHAGWSAVSLLAAVGIAAPLAAFTTQIAAPEIAGDTGPMRLSATQPDVVVPQAAPRADASAAPILADDLIAMRAVGVEPADLDRFRNARGEVDADTAVAAKALGVDPDYINAMRSVFSAADLEEIIEARGVGVDAAYARSMRAIDPRADLDEIIGARAVGVTPAYAEEMRGHFPHIALDDLVSMRAVGVTGDYVRAMRSAGMRVESPDDAVEAHAIAGPRGRPQTLGRPAATSISVTRNGQTVVASPGESIARRRNPDGSVTTAIARPAQPQPPGELER